MKILNFLRWTIPSEGLWILGQARPSRQGVVRVVSFALFAPFVIVSLVFLPVVPVCDASRTFGPHGH